MKQLHVIQLDYLGSKNPGAFTLRFTDGYYDDSIEITFQVEGLDTPLAFALDLLKQHFEIFSISSFGDDSYIITTDNFDNIVEKIQLTKEDLYVKM